MCLTLAALVLVAAPTEALDGTATELLDAARAQELAVEFGRVVALTNELLRREERGELGQLSVDQRIEVYRLSAYANIAIGDTTRSQGPIRLIFRLRPDFALPAGTAPKVRREFELVRIEEAKLAAQQRALERDRWIRELKLGDLPASQAKGGAPLAFSVRLTDARGVVETMRIAYRRAGQQTYSSLGLERVEERWHGVLPAELTTSETGFTLQYWIETSDAAGPLLAVGSAAAPLEIAVTAGRPPGPRRPLPRWAFFVPLAATAVAGGTTAVFGLAFYDRQQAYTGLSGEQAGRAAVVLEEQARRSQVARDASLIATVVLAAVTAVLFFFVDWQPQ